MAKKRALPPGTPEYAVDQETLMQFFSPPIKKSTFYKLRSDGYIVPLEAVRGRYRLNLSLVRMGLEAVDKLPEPDGDPAYKERLTQLAVSYASHAAGVPSDPPIWIVTQKPSAEMEEQALLLALLFYCDLRKLEYRLMTRIARSPLSFSPPARGG